ncbi:hypothetical protein CEP88_02595 [Roseobacter denitrificans]|nr:hypothetical protein CEP88_02595 [Roseobacter denitrificans]
MGNTGSAFCHMLLPPYAPVSQDEWHETHLMSFRWIVHFLCKTRKANRRQVLRAIKVQNDYP